MPGRLNIQRSDALYPKDLWCGATHTSRIQPVRFGQSSFRSIELGQSPTATLHRQT
jgi:hypothetical protein